MTLSLADIAMETPIIQSWGHLNRPNVILRPSINTSTLHPHITIKRPPTRATTNSPNIESNLAAMNSNYSVYNNFLKDNSSIGGMWNGSEDSLLNATQVSELDYDYQMLNATLQTRGDSWALCKEWTPAQHNLFQTANFFFAAAFLVPGSFKQSVLLVR